MLADPNTHPHARGGDYDPWCRPDPRRDFIFSLAFAQQRGNAVMLWQASAWRSRNRAGGRHATGACAYFLSSAARLASCVVFVSFPLANNPCDECEGATSR